MAAYSHRYTIGRGNITYKGQLLMEEDSTFATTYETNLSGLNSTQQTALGTFLTAVNTLNTAMGNIDDIHITINSARTKGKIDMTL